jgi:hypothetical protein
MSKWIRQLESVLRKKEFRPTDGKWYTRAEVNVILKNSSDNCRKFLIWASEKKKVKKFTGTTLTESKVLASKTFFKPLNKSWYQIYAEYAKSKEKRPEGPGWKTFTQLCRELKLSETLGRRALYILMKNKKIEVFRGGITDKSTRITSIKFYRLRG